MEALLDCPRCRLKWEPARLTSHRSLPAERDENGHITRFGRFVSYPLPLIRCVECKSVFDRPVEIVS